jgi:hypothetical protein
VRAPRVRADAAPSVPSSRAAEPLGPAAAAGTGRPRRAADFRAPGAGGRGQGVQQAARSAPQDPPQVGGPAPGPLGCGRLHAPIRHKWGDLRQVPRVVADFHAPIRHKWGGLRQVPRVVADYTHRSATSGGAAPGPPGCGRLHARIRHKWGDRRQAPWVVADPRPRRPCRRGPAPPEAGARRHGTARGGRPAARRPPRSRRRRGRGSVTLARSARSGGNLAQVPPPRRGFEPQVGVTPSAVANKPANTRVATRRPRTRPLAHPARGARRAPRPEGGAVRRPPPARAGPRQPSGASRAPGEDRPPAVSAGGRAHHPMHLGESCRAKPRFYRFLTPMPRAP